MGRAVSLRELPPVDDVRLTQFFGCLDDWARASGLEQAETLGRGHITAATIVMVP